VRLKSTTAGRYLWVERGGYCYVTLELDLGGTSGIGRDKPEKSGMAGLLGGIIKQLYENIKAFGLYF
jgi:hypothetical protein